MKKRDFYFERTYSFVHAKENVHGTYSRRQVINLEPQLLVCDHHVGELSIWLADLIFEKVQLFNYSARFLRAP